MTRNLAEPRFVTNDSRLEKENTQSTYTADDANKTHQPILGPVVGPDIRLTAEHQDALVRKAMDPDPRVKVVRPPLAVPLPPQAP